VFDRISPASSQIKLRLEIHFPLELFPSNGHILNQLLNGGAYYRGTPPDDATDIFG
jgi:hypothetical protein